ncbi:MAG: hypothetical protein FWC74_02925 [Candidatus Bathyarchaeota archaeon]|nr:hypothetical protein [Candidatus Termitimicrobium sp.]
MVSLKDYVLELYCVSRKVYCAVFALLKKQRLSELIAFVNSYRLESHARTIRVWRLTM